MITWVFIILSTQFCFVLFFVWMYTFKRFWKPQETNSIKTPKPDFMACLNSLQYGSADNPDRLVGPDRSDGCDLQEPWNMCSLGDPRWIIFLWSKLENREFVVCSLVGAWWEVDAPTLETAWCHGTLDILRRPGGLSLLLIWIHIYIPPGIEAARDVSADGPNVPRGSPLRSTAVGI